MLRIKKYYGKPLSSTGKYDKLKKLGRKGRRP